MFLEVSPRAWTVQKTKDEDYHIEKLTTGKKHGFTTSHVGLKLNS